ncbi:hypothetical protein PB2503_03492 [Parvularcula bermudensis HTCC2503]|uniref:Uncharacterized protein n=1 Tax=Parvularcula bermudensis (strain ATCC BAA-594 / HTCC2503 / KCTC 12087) TaxID=314260 RepID=E0TDL8_PARBH|nr:hypothetical protein PB2503_03492 [Parvularcula bermudensis HTCC2503]
MTERQKEKRILHVDIDADFNSSQTISYTIDVVFDPSPFSTGIFEKVDFYVGSTGVNITIDFFDGEVHGFTEEISISVEYTNDRLIERYADLTISPKIELSSGKASMKTEVGSIHRKKGERYTQSSAFQCREAVLTPIDLGSGVRWLLQQPRSDKAIRDFLAGNLHLAASHTPGSATSRGTVTARLSDIRIFDGERRPVSARKSLLMLFKLFEAGMWLTDSKSVSFEFELQRADSEE